jgi:hypothetical protein
MVAGGGTWLPLHLSGETNESTLSTEQADSLSTETTGWCATGLASFRVECHPVSEAPAGSALLGPPALHANLVSIVLRRIKFTCWFVRPLTRPVGSWQPLLAILLPPLAILPHPLAILPHPVLPHPAPSS